jgi:hypothetical protein
MTVLKVPARARELLNREFLHTLKKALIDGLGRTKFHS